MINRANINEQIYDLLRQRIMNRVYHAGERISVDALQGELQVSKTPIKEAVHRLSGEGLLEIRPRQGTYVATTSPQRVGELLEMRLMMETYVINQCFDQFTKDHIAQMQENLQEYRRLVRSHAGHNDFVEVDLQFHLIILLRLDNATMHDMYRKMSTHIQVARTHSVYEGGRHLQTIEEHATIIEGLRTDKTQAVKALRDHIRNVRQTILYYQQKEESVS